MIKGDITINTSEIHKIIRIYFENLYLNKLENLEEMNKFLDAFDQPKLSQNDIKHGNRSIINKKIESVIKCLPTRKTQDLRFEFYKTFKTKTNTNTPQIFL
jgi:hypothetical protein